MLPRFRATGAGEGDFSPHMSPKNTILVSLQKKNTFEAAAKTAAVSATRWKTRVYVICGFAAARPFRVSELKNASIFKLNDIFEELQVKILVLRVDISTLLILIELQKKITFEAAC